MTELLSLAKGCYQRQLILGNETWSGSSLKGAARSKWGVNYWKSRKGLLKRIEAARLGYLTLGKRGKIELVIGRPPGYYVPRRCSCGVAWVPGPKTILDDIVEAAG